MLRITEIQGILCVKLFTGTLKFVNPSAIQRRIVTIETLLSKMAVRMFDDMQFSSYNSQNVAEPDWMKCEHSTGTSIMAVEYKDGVVIGADSRTTTGEYIANRVSDKLTKITDNIYCCRSGSAADTQAIANLVAYQLAFHEVEMGEQSLVKTAASLFREFCYNYRDQLSAGIIVAGWDKRNGGQVYSIPIGGMCVRQQCAIGGSGSSYIYGYVDSSFKAGMEMEECATFVKNSLSLAMARDGSSGGVVRLGIITKDGIERRVVSGEKLPKFYEG